jgi:hypothetical protein
MLSLSNTVFDRTATLQRLPDLDDDTDWGGDQADNYATLESNIDCRVEMTDIDQWTVWLPHIDNEPHYNDKLIIGTLELFVIRVKPWTGLDGTGHHYELTAKEVLETRTFSNA